MGATRTVKVSGGTAIQSNGVTLNPAGATSGQVLAFDGSEFVPNSSAGAAHTLARNAVDDFGCVGDGTTDNTTTINNAITAMKVGNKGGTLFFPRGVYVCTGTINANSTANIVFVGESGQSIGEGVPPATVLKYTGTGTRFIDARSSSGFGLSNLAIIYSDNTFSNFLIDLSHDDSAADAAYSVIERCLLAGIDSSCQNAILLYWRNAIYNTIRECHLRFAAEGIVGRESSADYSDGNRILHCTFDNLCNGAIRDLGTACTIMGCGFDGTADITGSGLTRAYADTDGANTGGSVVSFIGNWTGDAVSVTSWLFLRGGQWTILGNAFQGSGVAIDITRSMTGLLISGNGFSATVGIDFNAFNVSTNNHTGVVVVGNAFTSGTPFINNASHYGITIFGNTPYSTSQFLPNDITLGKITINGGDPIAQHVTATAAYAGTTINANDYYYQDISLGCSPKDCVIAGYIDNSDQGLPLGVTISAHGASIGTARVVLSNNTGSPISVNAGTLRVRSLRTF